MADRQKGRYTNGSGKTCQNCARAKIRCIRSEATGSCDRCARLGKSCHFREGQIVKPTGQWDSKDRIEALEAKVDQLLAQSGTRIPVQDWFLQHEYICSFPCAPV